ncbi:MAG: hypothetical protein U5K81_10560 [Trueperaceae bacterium]|nr:hypothetical protein [Trueperaceae bacterium]
MPNDEATARALQREYDLDALDAWIASLPDDAGITPDPDAPPDLTRWPANLPPPPPEPPGVWEALQHLEASGREPDAAFAAGALFHLAIARTVREVQA